MILAFLIFTATFRPATPTVGDLVTIDFQQPVMLDPSTAYEVVSRKGNRVVVRTFEPKPIALSGVSGGIRFHNLNVPIRSVLKPKDKLEPAPLRPPRGVPRPAPIDRNEFFARYSFTTSPPRAGTTEYTPTPAISHAILAHNRGRTTAQADGIVVTPSHNPPADGGFKYNPPNGGPADTSATSWIEAQANEIMEGALASVKRLPYQRALSAATTHRHDYLNTYVRDLGNVVDMEAGY